MANEEVGIRLTLQGRREAGADLDATEQDLKDVGEAAETAGKKAEQSSGKWSKLRGVMGVVGRGAMVGVGLVAAVGAAAATTGLKTAASMETAKIGFTTMLGSAKKAKVFLSGLSKFAAKTPFEFPELQTAASSLISAGVNAKKVVPIMTTLGDVTAGMGTGSEGIKRATVALQQMNAAGRITGEDLNQLRDAGIPVYDLLAAATGRSKKEVTALAQEGKLGAKDLAAMMKALETGKGLEKFNGLMKKQSGSLTGVWSTLKDTVNMGLAKAVKPALPLVKKLVLAASDLAEKAMPSIRRGVKGAAGAVTAFVAAVETGGFKNALSGLSAPGTEKGASGIASSFGKIGDAVSGIDWAGVKDGLGQGTSDTISVFSVAIGFAADHVDELAKYLPMLVAGMVAWKVAQAAGNVVALASIPLRIVEVAAMIAHTSALRANTGATNVGLLASIRSRIAAVAGAVATGAMAVATGAWTAAQWLLNAALTANPIGLLVVGIALAIGAFVLMYRKVDWFRAGVKYAMDKVVGAASFAWGWIKGHWPLLLAILTGPFGIAVLLITRNWDKIKAGASAMKDFVVNKFDALVGFVTSIPGRITGAVSGAFDGIKNGFRGAINWIIGAWNGLSFGIPGFDPPGPGPKFAGVTVSTPDIPMLARGGPVAANRPYIVGEQRPELFVPRVNGMILPRVPDMPDLSDVDVTVGPIAPGGPRILQIVMPDGRVLAEVVLEELADMEANA